MVKTASRQPANSSQKQAVIILAAGLGKRMHSPLPKVLHEIGGQPLLFHILRETASVAPDAPVALIVGHGREKVEQAVRKDPSLSKLDITFIHQAEQRGTGHAARCAMDSDWGGKRVREKALVLVLPGDLPLLPAGLVEQMLQPLGRNESMRLLTCELPDPTGYGRIVRRGKSGPVLRIVEERDATDREKLLREVGASIYSFQAAFLRFGLQKVSNKNAQGEFYLTDLVSQASRSGKRIDVLAWRDPEDVRGVNDPWELALAAKLLNGRCLKRLALAGVKIVDPSTTWIDCSVRIEPEAVIHPGAVLRGATRIGRGALIGPHAVLNDVEVGEETEIKAGTTGESSQVGARCHVGPYAHLRPGSKVGNGAKIGNFVELKKASVGDRTSIAHLSYVGDAEVGRDVNIGCGFVTCNFDGRIIDGERKHRTVIEDGVFVGSDCQTVAPVRLGRGCYIASGSTITEDVEADALAIARSRQVNKPGHARKLRDGA